MKGAIPKEWEVNEEFLTAYQLSFPLLPLKWSQMECEA